MTTPTITYPNQLASKPDVNADWLAQDGSVIDLTAYTLSLKVGRADQTLITKTTGVNAFATSPNLQIVWDDEELSVLSAGNWMMEIRAVDDDGKDRFMYATLVIEQTALT